MASTGDSFLHRKDTVMSGDTPSGEQSVALLEQRALVLDMVALTKSPSLEGVVSAIIDDINIQSPLTAAQTPTTAGTRLVGTVIDGYLGDTFSGFRNMVDSALQFGLIDEQTLRELTINPEPVVAPLRNMLEHVSNKNNLNAKGFTEFDNVINSNSAEEA